MRYSDRRVIRQFAYSSRRLNLQIEKRQRRNCFSLWDRCYIFVQANYVFQMRDARIGDQRYILLFDDVREVGSNIVKADSVMENTLP